jgi:hypothetical protein
MHISGKVESGHSPVKQQLPLKFGLLWFTSFPEEKEREDCLRSRSLGLFLSAGLNEGDGENRDQI